MIEDMLELFYRLPVGAHFVSDLDFNKTYIKPVQDKAYHLDTMVVSLDTGELFHFSQVIGDQVHWGTQEDSGYPNLIKKSVDKRKTL